MLNLERSIKESEERMNVSVQSARMRLKKQIECLEKLIVENETKFVPKEVREEQENIQYKCSSRVPAAAVS